MKSDENRQPPASDPSAPEADAALASRVVELEQQLEEKSREAKENYDRYVREVADGENFKKRMQRDKADSIRFANESLIRDLLPVVDNLEWAIDHAGAAPATASIVEGVRLTLKMFRDLLERAGVVAVDAAEGSAFDPLHQEAVGAEASTSVPPNAVLRVQQKGYLLRDRLLRPARVIVAVAPAAGGEASSESQG